MEREPLSRFIYVNLSASDRHTIERWADERGATLSNVIRRLIKEAAQKEQQAKETQRELAVNRS